MWTAAITPSAPDLLVVGGTGFLGRHLVAAAPETTIAIRTVAATHHASPVGATNVAWHRCDLADGGTAVAHLIERLRPRAVINAAYVQGGEALHAITARAPTRMATACRRVGARFVHVSTDVVFDGTTDRPYRETDPRTPVHVYGWAKAESETGVLDANADAVVVRTSLLWGDRADPGPQVLLTTRSDMTFYTDEYRNPIAVRSLANACLELVERTDITGLLHVAGANTVSRLEFASRVCALVGVDATTLRGASRPDDPARPANCPLDSSRARSLLTTPLPGIQETTP